MYDTHRTSGSGLASGGRQPTEPGPASYRTPAQWADAHRAPSLVRKAKTAGQDCSRPAVVPCTAPHPDRLRPGDRIDLFEEDQLFLLVDDDAGRDHHHQRGHFTAVADVAE